MCRRLLCTAGWQLPALEGHQLLQPSSPAAAAAAAASAAAAQVVCNRAAAAAKLGRHDDALADAELAIELDSSYAKAYVRRAQVRVCVPLCTVVLPCTDARTCTGSSSSSMFVGAQVY